MAKKQTFDLYTFVAEAAVERGEPFPLKCNCGGVVTVMPPFQDRAVTIGQNIQSAGDFGTYFEFGISNDINIGFHLGAIHAISTKNPPDENKL